MNRRSISLLFSLAKQNLRFYVGAILATIVVVLSGFVTPLLLSVIINALVDAPMDFPGFVISFYHLLGGRDTVLSNLPVVALSLIGIQCLNALGMYYKSRLTAQASESIARTVRNDLYTHLQHLTYEYHVKAETGDLIQRCTSDVETVRRFLAMQLLEIVNALALVCTTLFLLISINVPLTLLSLLMVPILFVGSYVYSKKIMKGFRISDEAEGKMSTTLQESLTGVRVVRAFGRQQFEVEKFEQSNKNYTKKAWKILHLLALFWAGTDTMAMLQTGITLLVGIGYAANGVLSVGALTFFISSVGKLLWPVRQLGRLLSDGGKALVSISRIDEIMRQPLDADTPDCIEPSICGDIVFDDVHFAYDGGLQVLRGVSFTIKQGQTAAILGGTGSGKSSLVHLLQRLYTPQKGRITIGGVPIENISKKWLRSHVGLVLQEPFLYSKTIKENIAIVAPDDDFANAQRAASIARADGFIEVAEKGYDTIVGERGVTLSGGQKQRVAIVRTLLKNNDILIFDDSLSAVDTQTDAAIRKSLREVRKNVTTIIISHRITTLSEADIILVLDEGKIIQQGTHQQLTNAPGLYQRINNIQNSLENELASSMKSEVE